jgi:hypothetical protein
MLALAGHESSSALVTPCFLRKAAKPDFKLECCESNQPQSPARSFLHGGIFFFFFFLRSVELKLELHPTLSGVKHIVQTALPVISSFGHNSKTNHGYIWRKQEKERIGIAAIVFPSYSKKSQQRRSRVAAVSPKSHQSSIFLTLLFSASSQGHPR